MAFKNKPSLKNIKLNKSIATGSNLILNFFKKKINFVFCDHNFEYASLVIKSQDMD